MTITSEQDILITTTNDSHQSAPPSIGTIDAINGPPCEQVLLGVHQLFLVLAHDHLSVKRFKISLVNP